jgi:YHS domain-containing protein
MSIPRRLFLPLCAALIITGPAMAQVPQSQAPQNQSSQSKPPQNIDKAGLAIQGYDPVAYQTFGKPTKGAPDITATHDGATYRFVSVEHKMAFEKEPAKYLPQYGGYCAYAIASGYTAAVDPTAWKVVEGKLYLNYNASVAKSWAAKAEGYIKSGDVNWRDWRKLKSG